VEVPTDVVPFYDASNVSDLVLADFTLTSSAGDAIVAQAAARQLYTVDLELEKTLQPNTTYTLVASLDAPSGYHLTDSVTFTTGAGPASAVPAPPQAFLQHYQFDQPRASSCSPMAEGTCVAVTGGLAIEETPLDEFGQEWRSVYLHRGPWFTNLSGINQGTGLRCVKLRTRGANAVYSSPVELCGAEAPLFTLRGSERIACTSQGMTQDGALVTASRGGPEGSAGSSGTEIDSPPGSAPGTAGCSMTPLSRASASSALSALFALALAARFRRARRARIGR
jgi:hypothetical protein